MPETEEVDWDDWHPFESQEPRCEICDHHSEVSRYCRLKGRCVERLGLCPDFRYRRVKRGARSETDRV